MPQFEEITLGRITRGRKTSMLLAVLVFSAHYLMYRKPPEALHDSFLSWLILPLEDVVGEVGWRLYHGSIYALTALLFFSFLHRLTTQRWLAAAGAALLVLNPLVFAFPYPHSGGVALLAGAGALAALFARPRRPFVIGALGGLMLATSPAALVLVPAFWGWLGLTERQTAEPKAARASVVTALVWMALGGLVVVVPVLALASGVFGPSSVTGSAHLIGDTALGKALSLDAIFNYPFYSHIIRTPHFPFPAFVYYLLVVLKAFGIAIIVVGLLGVLPAWGKYRSVALLMSGWFLLTYFFWAFREDLSLARLTDLYLLLPPIAFFVSVGLERLGRLGMFRRNVLLSVLWASGLYFGLKVTYFLEFSQDMRWYAKHVPTSGVVPVQDLRQQAEAIVESVRTHQRFGPLGMAPVRPESPAEHQTSKRELTQGSLLPSWIMPPSGLWGQSFQSLLDEWRVEE